MTGGPQPVPDGPPKKPKRIRWIYGDYERTDLLQKVIYRPPGGGGGGTLPPDTAKLVANERLKLLANNLDRASTACFTIGVATPLAGWFYGVSGLDKMSVWWLLLGFAGWLVAGAALHWQARRVLRGLLP